MDNWKAHQVGGVFMCNPKISAKMGYGLSKNPLYLFVGYKYDEDNKITETYYAHERTDKKIVECEGRVELVRNIMTFLKRKSKYLMRRRMRNVYLNRYFIYSNVSADFMVYNEFIYCYN